MNEAVKNVKEGRTVTIDEFAPHADKDCRTCLGKGVVMLSPVEKVPVKTDDGRTLYGQLHVPKACGCAVVRFIKKHRQELILTEGAPIRWKGP